MLTTTRENILAAVERMGAAHCCYSHRDWSQTCDCKYGAMDLTLYSSGEQTGCPELRGIKLALSRMTDAEWDALMRGESVLAAAVEQERRRCTQIVENEISAYRTAAAFGVDDIDATLGAIAARIAGEENQE